MRFNTLEIILQFYGVITLAGTGVGTDVMQKKTFAPPKTASLPHYLPVQVQYERFYIALYNPVIPVTVQVLATASVNKPLDMTKSD